MTRPTLFFFALFLTVASFAQQASYNHAAVDTSKYAILPYNRFAAMAVHKNFIKASSTSLSVLEVNELEPSVDSAYLAYNRRHADRKLYEPLSTYLRQYFPLIDSSGQKQVWINFFCSAADWDWKHYAWFAEDGGVCIFQLSINMTTGLVGPIVVQRDMPRQKVQRSKN